MFGSPAKVKAKSSKHPALRSRLPLATSTGILVALALCSLARAEVSEIRHAIAMPAPAIEAAQAAETPGAPLDTIWKPTPHKQTCVACDARYTCPTSAVQRPAGVTGVFAPEAP